jgi:protein SCO1/2
MMTHWRTLAALGPLFAAAAMMLAPPLSAHSLKEVEDKLLKREAYVEIVNRPAPEFSLHDADNTPASLADYRGMVLVLNFVYASCPDVCPLQSAVLASIQEKINATPMRDLVQFISITTDPENDTADILGFYAARHGLDPVNWIFLTSGADRPAATRQLARQYGLKFTATGDGYQMHGTVTHLIDKSGNLRARYHGLKFNETNLILHLNALTNDDH